MTTSVSFDLDGTLIGCDGPVEPLGFIGRILGSERLRLGTRRLIRELHMRGFATSVYTTSLRSHYSIRNTFRSHGLCLDRIVNGDDHQQQTRDGSASKRPDRFGFTIHVDDAPIGLADTMQETRVIVVDKADLAWVDTILNQIGAPNQTSQGMPRCARQP